MRLVPEYLIANLAGFDRPVLTERLSVRQLGDPELRQVAEALRADRRLDIVPPCTEGF
jgi:hypothetical protein